MAKPMKKGMKIFLIVLSIIIVTLAIAGGVIGYKLTHLISAETMEEINSIYRQYSTDAQTIDSIHDLAVITSISQTKRGEGPITITPALLNDKEITLITLGGTQMKEGQATSFEESKLASQGKSNDYLKAVLKLFNENKVPKDRPLVIAGISLGGMIAQQLIGESVVTDNYTIEAVITFGSPITMPFDRKGVKVVRFVDANDIVPKLGEKHMDNKNDSRIASLQKSERILKTGSHKDGVETHALSYISDKIWNEYDFLGNKNGSSKIVLQKALTFYPAPKLS